MRRSSYLRGSMNNKSRTEAIPAACMAANSLGRIKTHSSREDVKSNSPAMNPRTYPLSCTMCAYPSERCGGPCLQTAPVIIHAGNEPAPFMSRTAVGQQRGRAILPRPIIMRNHITERNMVLLHQHCRQLGGAVPGGPPGLRGGPSHSAEYAGRHSTGPP